MQHDSNGVMITTEMLTALIVALGGLIAGVFTGIGALLKLWWDKGAKARVAIIQAESVARGEENERELQAEIEENAELRAKFDLLEAHNRKCDEDRAKCREDLATLRGYMNAKFEKVELKITQLEKSTVPASAIEESGLIDTPPRLTQDQQ